MPKTTTAVSTPSQIAQVSKLFRQRDVDAAAILASLINSQPTLETLEPVLDDTIKELLHYSFTQREQIDSLVTFLHAVATQIKPSVSHPGHPPLDLCPTMDMRPSNGPTVLAECLSHDLYESLWDRTSRDITPDDEYDRTRPKSYYFDASVHATVLARAFAMYPIFRERLWREAEDVLVKGLLSGTEQEPGVFTALTALLLGAGEEIREFLSQEGIKGMGLEWVWYNNTRMWGDVAWGWTDLMMALKDEPGETMAARLPSYIRASFEKAKKHIGDGSGSFPSWGSERLAKEAFGWGEDVL
ncbi:hypothetical protein Hypma_004325 [Hypsizygus marmoreus]|uniref:Uncharacterized protein n=1 Tax=Hypsizygus marmoreus TaxID=39966 RepID=A0A369K3K4_HYPMA|nr:hypothetical protein Hypma_004325 [Hypsizygus marmoreus]